MLHNPARTSASSGSSLQPIVRHNTMSSTDGSRSMRASKRYSVTALYLSMNANQRDLEIEDDLARGMASEDVQLYCMTGADIAQRKRHSGI